MLNLTADRAYQLPVNLKKKTIKETIEITMWDITHINPLDPDTRTRAQHTPIHTTN